GRSGSSGPAVLPPPGSSMLLPKAWSCAPSAASPTRTAPRSAACSPRSSARRAPERAALPLAAAARVRALPTLLPLFHSGAHAAQNDVPREAREPPEQNPARKFRSARRPEVERHDPELRPEIHEEGHQRAHRRLEDQAAPDPLLQRLLDHLDAQNAEQRPEQPATDGPRKRTQERTLIGSAPLGRGGDEERHDQEHGSHNQPSNGDPVLATTPDLSGLRIAHARLTPPSEARGLDTDRGRRGAARSRPVCLPPTPRRPSRSQRRLPLLSCTTTDDFLGRVRRRLAAISAGHLGAAAASPPLRFGLACLRSES